MKSYPGHTKNLSNVAVLATAVELASWSFCLHDHEWA